MPLSAPGSEASPLVYVVADTGRRAIAGASRPRRGTMAAVLKEDGPESPTCVYCEPVSSRLELFGVPMALGVQSQGQSGPP